MPNRFAAHFADTFTDPATPPAPNRFVAHFADAMPSAEPSQPRAAETPRTWGEAGMDTVLGLTRGVRNVAGGLAGMPVDALNFVNQFSPANLTPQSWGLRPPVLSQPQAVRDYQAFMRSEDQREQDAMMSDKGKRQLDEFDQVDGFWDSTKYLATNPSFLGTTAVEQLPQLAIAVPGRLKTTIGLQSALAGAMNESETASELAPRVAAGEMAQAEADRRALDVFTGTALLNAGTAALPGAQTLERVFAGQATRVPAGRAMGHVATSFLGEAAQEGLTEAGEQVLQNLATDKPWHQDTGKMGALGALLGGPMGGTGATVEALANRGAHREQAHATPPVDFLQAAMQAMREQQAVQATPDTARAEASSSPPTPDIDALLMQNLNEPVQDSPAPDPQPQSMIERAKATIRRALAAAKGNKQHNDSYELMPVAAEEVAEAAEHGIDIAGYRHVIDGSAIRHTFKNHGDSKTEQERGQIAVTDADLESIPDILAVPDRTVFGLKNRIGNDVIGYLKTMPDGSTVYLEAIRTGKGGTLATQSMWKYPPATAAASIEKALRLTSETLRGDVPTVNTAPAARNFFDEKAPSDAAAGRATATPTSQTASLTRDSQEGATTNPAANEGIIGVSNRAEPTPPVGQEAGPQGNSTTPNSQTQAPAQGKELN